MPRIVLLSFGAALLGVGVASAQPAPSPSPGPSVPSAVAAPEDGWAQPSTGNPLPTGIFAPPAASGADPLLTFSADYLLWAIKSPRTPPLLTSSSNPADRATLGMPTTGIVTGGGTTDLGTFSGGRLFANYRLDDVWSVQVGGFLLEQKSKTSGAQSNSAGSPSLGVPFVSAFNGLPQADLLASPGALTGGAASRVTSSLWGTEANLAARAYDQGGLRLDVLGGFRNANLHEQLRQDTTSTLTSTPGLFNGSVVGPGTTFDAFDQFGTRNSFYGGQVGLRGVWEIGILSLSAFGKVALGDSHEQATINGGTLALMPDGSRSSAPGGTLALASNMGKLSTDRFAVLPEAGFNLGVRVTDRVTLFGGYQFMYWSDVVRPGDQVNPVVNRNLIPVQSDGTRLGSPMPTAVLRHTDFWAQGVNFGVNFAW